MKISKRTQNTFFSLKDPKRVIESVIDILIPLGSF
jgi:hypothetical protein